MINFNNTEIAFKSKSDKDLKRARQLFKIVASPVVVKAGTVLTNIALGVRMPIGWAVKPNIYKHFVGGESIEECLPVVRSLQTYKVRAILDYSVEGGSSNADIEKAMSELIKSIKNAAKDKNVPYAVFKPTALTSTTILEKASSDKPLSAKDKDEVDKFRQRVDTLCKTAFDVSIPILIDAEDYAFQRIIDEVVNEMMEKYNKKHTIVFNTFQMYRHDRLDFLKESYQKAVAGNYNLGAKFVRGAYMEAERERAAKMGYPSPIHPDKAATDKAFNDALIFCADRISKISIFCGTHNEESCLLLTELMKKHNIEKNRTRVYFAQLYGMSDHISFNLASEGYNVAKYLPYGPVKYVMPYLLRRAEENTSIAGQTGRELNLINMEIERRKKK